MTETTSKGAMAKSQANICFAKSSFNTRLQGDDVSLTPELKIILTLVSTYNSAQKGMRRIIVTVLEEAINVFPFY